MHIAIGIGTAVGAIIFALLIGFQWGVSAERRRAVRKQQRQLRIATVKRKVLFWRK